MTSPTMWIGARRTLPNLKPTTQTISLRLPKHLLDAIKAAANARDVPYQSLIRVWLLQQVERS
jgi:predicted DNA binding CopG/RHH family protein